MTYEYTPIMAELNEKKIQKSTDGALTEKKWSKTFAKTCKAPKWKSDVFVHFFFKVNISSIFFECIV